MLAIAAAGAFVGLFALWVILPRKFLRDKQGRHPRPGRGAEGRQAQNPAENSASAASNCG